MRRLFLHPTPLCDLESLSPNMSLTPRPIEVPQLVPQDALFPLKKLQGSTGLWGLTSSHLDAEDFPPPQALILFRALLCNHSLHQTQ